MYRRRLKRWETQPASFSQSCDRTFRHPRRTSRNIIHPKRRGWPAVTRSSSSLMVSSLSTTPALADSGSVHGHFPSGCCMLAPSGPCGPDRQITGGHRPGGHRTRARVNQDAHGDALPEPDGAEPVPLTGQPTDTQSRSGCPSCRLCRTDRQAAAVRLTGRRNS